MKKKPKKVVAKSDINITPLIDILLVLLVIFMTITPQTPKALDAAVPQPPPPDAQPKPQDNDLIIVSLDKEGVIKINSDTVELAALGTRLKEIFSARADKTMFINADPELRFEQVVTIIDTAKGMNVDKVGLMTERLMAR
ncbi:MAG TPA: biopolymer transporter ExbD [Terriglobia bacterium]|nr:biopolymer transporter ExbD [Terriglobia bacterium]